MHKSNKTSALDFLVTLFVNDTVVSYTLSEIVKRRNDSSLEIPDDFSLPVFQQEIDSKVAYIMKQQLNDKYNMIVNGELCDEHLISSGDYITFENKEDKNIVIKLLFVATKDIEAGYKKYKINNNSNIFIGRTSANDISFDLNNYISREKHIAIRIDDCGNAFVEDLKRSIGVYVNGKLTHSQKLEIFDEIYMMGLSIVFLGDSIAVRNLRTESKLQSKDSFLAKNLTENNIDKQDFVITPRILKSLDKDVIEIDAPPSPFKADKTPAILVVGPSLTMSMVMIASLSVSITNAINGGQITTIITSAVMAIGMFAGSFMWPMLLRNYQKRRVAAEEKHRCERYSSYIADIEKVLIEKKERSVRILNESLYPSPSALCSLLDSESNRLRLWERAYEDSDFLDVRIGLGERPFEVQLKIPRQGFQLYKDDLRNLPEHLSDEYKSLKDVPLTLDIASNRTVGIIGSKLNIMNIVNEMILNIISLHSYDEVKIVIVTSSKCMDDFSAFKNVPHIWSNDKKIRFFATNHDEAHFVFNVIDEVIRERENDKGQSVKPIPHYVVIVTEPDLVEKESLLRYTDDSYGNIGFTAIFAYGDITKLPKLCKTIIQSDNTRTGYYIKNKNANKFISFSLDNVDVNSVYNFANKLSQLPIKRDVRTLAIVDRISFLQMYQAGNVDQLNIEYHWDNNNSAKSLAAPIGVISGGDVFNLDLHEAYHGCHGLVAGTTGSGKSEFLQAFILSLAINYSPKEIAFVLIDFKGGDMARPFMAKTFSPALPHLSATISNLSGNILYRALVSLEAEIKSRQRIFNESASFLGVDKLDINSYHKYYKGGRLDTPLPHLVIIIDEFAQLKTQQPEFLTQLINVAQVGRSLGIHLILATQKPSGTVDPQIMSNSRFKVCLKVTDKQDSIDVINKPDAATIKNPGRLYLQVGYDEVYECIQSGYSGSAYAPTKEYMPDEEITIQMTDNTANPIHSAKIDFESDKSDKTQLETIVSKIVSIGQKRNVAAKPLWLDMLPEKIIVSDLQKGKKGLCTSTIGLVDYVRSQQQKSLTIEFAQSGHVAIYGASGTGKTTFLQTLVYSMVCEYGYTPQELTLYIMDFSGRNLGYLSELPHTGGVVFADEESKIMELSYVLHNILDERKRLFANNDCGTFSDYCAVSKNKLPAVVVLIDNYANFHNKYLSLSEEFVDIISAGETFGIYFVITGNTRSAIHYKTAEHISTYFTLKMNNDNDYLDILNTRPPITPEPISGRGITVINKEVVEFQVALAFDGVNESDRISEIKNNYNRIANEWTGYKPIKIGENIDSLENDDVSVASYLPISKNNPPEAVEDLKENLILGMSKSGATLYGITLSDDYKLCVCANNSDDMNVCYQNVFKNIVKYDNRRIVFIDDERHTFKDISLTDALCRYIENTTEFDNFIEELKPELNDRLENPDADFDRLFIFISEFNEFFKRISDDQADFMRKVLQFINSPQYGIYFICGFNVNGDKSNDRIFMSLVVNAENYLLCPNSYNEALSKIETMPILQSYNNNGYYFCQNDKNIEIKW